MLIVTGCVRSIGDSYCKIAFPIYSVCPMVGEPQKLGQDTHSTCNEIDDHNIQYEAVCE